MVLQQQHHVKWPLAFGISVRGWHRFIFLTLTSFRSTFLLLSFPLNICCFCVKHSTYFFFFFHFISFFSLFLYFGLDLYVSYFHKKKHICCATITTKTKNQQLASFNRTLILNECRQTTHPERMNEIKRQKNEPHTHTHAIQIGCCGADGSNDYIIMRQPLPSTCRDTVTGNAFFHGCVDELTWLLEDKSSWVAGLAMTLSFISVRMITL